MWRRDAEPGGAIVSASAIGPDRMDVIEIALLAQLAPKRVLELLATLDAAAGQQPVVAVVLAVAYEQHLRSAVEDRRDAQARRLVHAELGGRAVREPRRAESALVALARGKLVRRRDGSSSASRTSTSWAMRSPTARRTGSRRSVLCAITSTSPR